MAFPNDRFWVGGSGTWNSSNTALWSTTSGGPGGASVPTTTNDVYFDAASGAASVTIASGRVCANLITTGFTGTLTGSGSSYFYVYGTVVTFGNSGVIVPNSNPQIYFAGGGTCTLTTNGQTLGDIVIINNTTLVLADNLICQNNSILYLQYGTFNANNKTVSIGQFTDSGTASPKTLYMGNKPWVLGSCGPISSTTEYVWNVSSPANITIPDASTAKIILLRYKGAAAMTASWSGPFSNITLSDVTTTYTWPTSGYILIDNTYLATYNNRTGTILTGVNSSYYGSAATGTSVLIYGPSVTTLGATIVDTSTVANIYLADMSITGNGGYLLIDDEVINYTARSATSGAGYVSGITRNTSYGQGASMHFTGYRVRPAEARLFYTGGSSLGLPSNAIICASNGHFIKTTFNYSYTFTASNVVSYAGGLGKGRHLIVLTATTVTYPFTSATWTYGNVNLNEGTPYTFFGTFYGIDYTPMYWKIISSSSNYTSAVNADFVNYQGSGNPALAPNGNFIDGRTFSFIVQPTADSITEGREQFAMVITTGNYYLSAGYTIIAPFWTNNFYVEDTSNTAVTPTATLTSGYATSLYEGETYTYNVTTTNVPNGTSLYWSMSNPYYGNRLSTYWGAGSFTVNSNAGSFSLTLPWNNNIQGTSTFYLCISAKPIARGGSIYTFQGNLNSPNQIWQVAMYDSNQTISGQSISSTFSVGENIYFPFTDWGKLWATITGFSNPYVYLSVYNFPNQYWDYTAYNTGPGYHVDSNNNVPLLTTSTSISIYDRTFNITTSPADLYYLPEGTTITFYASTLGFPTGTTFYWEVITLNSGAGYANAADFVAPTSGTYTINSAGSGTFSLTILNDQVADAFLLEMFTVRSYYGSNSSGLFVWDSVGSIIDSSSPQEEFFPFFM